MKKITFFRDLIVLVALLVGSGSAMGQTTLITNDCSTATAGWTFTNNTGNPIQQGGYWLLEATTSTKDEIITPALDVTNYTNLTLTFKVATYGSGTNNPAQVDYSLDGGTTWSETKFTSATPSSSTYINSGSIDLGTLNSSTLKIRFVNKGTALKGVRMDDILLVGTFAPSCTASNLAFGSPTTVEKLAGDNNFTKTATSLNETTAIIYSSSDTNVATVNSSTGEVDILAAGTTTITATQAAGTHNTVDYCAGEVTYTLNVAPVDPTITVTEETVPAMSAYVDASDSETITVNGLNLTTDITLTLGGTDADQFRLSTSTLTQTDGSVTDASVTIYYEPTTTGTHAATLTLSSADAADVTRTLSGTATWAPLDAPVATAADPVSQTAFTANWNAVAGATEYELTVKTKVGEGASDLFISEYIEGSSSNKAIEIFNGTGASVDLSDYELHQYNNGSATVSYTLALSGTLQNNDVYVIANSSGTIFSDIDLSTNSNVVNFNGDDAIVLYKKSSSSIVDIFGKIGEDPGSAWTVESHSTVNYTLVRKSTVSEGVTVNPTNGFATLNTEWDVYPIDNVANLGSHIFAGGVTLTEILGSPFTVVGTSKSFSGLNDGGTFVYTVKAKNANVKSSASNEIEVEVAGISVGTDNPTLSSSIYAHNAKIHFTATAGEKVEVYNAVGQKIISTMATDGQNELPVNAKGVMIVKVGSRLAKVIL